MGQKCHTNNGGYTRVFVVEFGRFHLSPPWIFQYSIKLKLKHNLLEPKLKFKDRQKLGFPIQLRKIYSVRYYQGIDVFTRNNLLYYHKFQCSISTPFLCNSRSFWHHHRSPYGFGPSNLDGRGPT